MYNVRASPVGEMLQRHQDHIRNGEIFAARNNRRKMLSMSTSSCMMRRRVSAEAGKNDRLAAAPNIRGKLFLCWHAGIAAQPLRRGEKWEFNRAKMSICGEEACERGPGSMHQHVFLDWRDENRDIIIHGWRR